MPPTTSLAICHIGIHGTGISTYHLYHAWIPDLLSFSVLDVSHLVKNLTWQVQKKKTDLKICVFIFWGVKLRILQLKKKKKNLGVLEVFGASFSSRLSWHQLPKHTFQNEVGNGMFKIHPRKFNSSPLKIGHPKRKVVFQPSYLRDYVKLRGCTSKVKGSPTNWMICFDVSKFFLDVGGAPCFRWTSQSILVCLGIRVAHCLSLFGCASTIP